MKRYSNIDYIMKMSFEDGVELILRAFKNDTKDRLYQMYVVNQVFMTEKNYISFEDFYKGRTEKKVLENREEIYGKVDCILQKALEKGGEN